MIRRLSSLLLLGVVLGAGCAHHAGSADVSDPAAVVAAARANAAHFAMQGRYNVRIRRGDKEVSTRGALVLDRGPRFRVEIFGPMGTPYAILASDGAALNVWMQSNSAFYRGDQAAAVLQSLTGGSVTLADVGRILTGRLPLPDAAVRSATVDGDAVAITLDAGQGAEVAARLDPKTGLLRTLAVQRAGEAPLISVVYGKAMKVGGERLPSEMTLTVAPLDMEVGIAMESWDELGQIPEVFSLAPPPGSVEKDLLEALKEAAAKQGVRPLP